MAALSIGSHFSPSYHFKKRSFHCPSVHSLPSFGSSLCRIRAPRLLRNGVLARAEDKARDSSSSPTTQQQGQPNKEKQLEELTSPSGSCDPLCSVDETSSVDFEATYQPKTDLLKTIAIFTAALTGTLAINLSWVASNEDVAMALLFAIGYAGIIFEESLAFNKSGIGLLMAVSLWVVRSIGVRISQIS
ncbi:sodium/proton antiporter 1 [Herrania umbratica]|uniref:Sodium/proton antiporter 1 n=1 Tax=Herrania umbratica TaxID=108875 RepID=A0A6J1A1H9_9ROSI|nr:sodium/proton antiporter 1 [Herrania umbratica]